MQLKTLKHLFNFFLFFTEKYISVSSQVSTIISALICIDLSPDKFFLKNINKVKVS